MLVLRSTGVTSSDSDHAESESVALSIGTCNLQFFSNKYD